MIAPAHTAALRGIYTTPYQQGSTEFCKFGYAGKTKNTDHSIRSRSFARKDRHMLVGAALGAVGYMLS